MVVAAVNEVLVANAEIVIAVVVLFGVVVLGSLIGRISTRVLTAVGFDESVAGTSIDRVARGFGLTAVTLVSRLLSWFLYVAGAVYAVQLANLPATEQLLAVVSIYLPRLFVAALVLIVGAIVADKAELFVAERLRDVKFPLVSVVPRLTRYTILFVAMLIALAHLGVATAALLVLLGGYLFGVVVIAAVTFRDLLASGAAGAYLLLRQPYTIGDEVTIGQFSGVVQEVDLFVTHLEDGEAEYVVPNRHVFEHGVIRSRDT